MSRNRLFMAVPALLLLFLVSAKGCQAVVVDAGPNPQGCQQAVFSPESAPVGSHYFGDGSGNMQLSADDMATAFKQSAACDPFQISAREMAWGLEPIPDEAARFKRQQRLAGDMGALTEASKRVNQIVDSSTFTVDTNWSGSYETLYAAATQDGWNAFKLRKSMSHETVLVQTTAGNRTFVWKVVCLWQPVAEILRGYPVGPPAGELPPGKKPPKPTPTTQPPPGTGTRPPTTRPPTTQPPHTTVTSPPPHPTTTWKCEGRPGICGTPNSGPEQQPVQENDPEQVAPTPGYTPGSAEEVDSGQHGSGDNPTDYGTDSGGGGGSSPGGSGSGSNGGSGGNAGTGNPEDADPNPGQQNPPGDPGSW